MPEDRSLDDFVGAGASEEQDEAVPESDEEDADVGEAEEPANATRTEDDAVASDEAPAETNADAELEVDGSDSADDVDDADTVDADTADAERIEPPSITATWVTDGVACERCDTDVERRWQCDGDYVCADCKDW